MDLWIKDQARKGLYKVDNIQVGSVIYPSTWVFTRLENNTVCLGEYDTEERALEVLDEIQNLLQPKLVLKTNITPIENCSTPFVTTHEVEHQSIDISVMVYQMPKE